MIRIKKIEIRNFLSFGNVPQEIYLDNPGINLILGENLDVGDGQNNRNGSGKTSILNAISYALFNQPLLDIKKDNCINTINEKNMYVSLVFEKNGKTYNILRGRKPNIFEFKIDDLVKRDEDPDLLQEEIEKIIGFNFLIFKYLIAFNTFSGSFLSLKQSEQRDFIENIFGLTDLTIKAEILKEKIKETKTEILKEDTKISTIENNNKNILMMIKEQEIKSSLWEKEKNKKIDELQKKLKIFENIDFQKEIENINTIEKLVDLLKKIELDINETKKEYNLLEIENKKIENDLNNINENIEILYKKYDDTADKNNISFYKKEIEKQKEVKRKTEEEIKSFEIKIKNYKKFCDFCNQKIEDIEHEEKYKNKIKENIEILRQKINESNQIIEDIERKICDIEKEIVEKNNKLKSSIVDFENKIIEIDGIYKKNKKLIKDKQIVIRQKEKEREEIIKEIERIKNDNTFMSKDDIYEYLKEYEKIKTEIENEKKKSNPYVDHIRDLKENAIKEVCYDNLKNLKTILEHQEFLLKLLNGKDSFIRRKIMDQNLVYLNHRLLYYLEELNMKHKIRFLNDLSVEISYLGRDMDFDNLSRGEKTRVSVALSLAFRDIYENLYDQINLLFIDEVFDSGLDSNGIESCYEILKKIIRDRKKCVYLISHREELVSKADNVIVVRKENGFSSIIN